jgi:hypothetical protein
MTRWSPGAEHATAAAVVTAPAARRVNVEKLPFARTERRVARTIAVGRVVMDIVSVLSSLGVRIPLARDTELDVAGRRLGPAE